MERPSVIIELQPYLQDYLLHEFGGKPTDSGVMVNSDSDIGNFIQSMVTLRDRPLKKEIKDYPFTIYLPISGFNHHILRENFFYIPEWKQQLIRKYIEASFRLKQREFFVTGYEKGFKQDIIIKSFLQAYNIRNNALNYESVKKYDYRNRMKTVKEVREMILSEMSD